jgi:hypothetical protein
MFCNEVMAAGERSDPLPPYNIATLKKTMRRHFIPKRVERMRIKGFGVGDRGLDRERSDPLLTISSLLALKDDTSSISISDDTFFIELLRG